MHERPSDFLLWIEISDAGSALDIQPPPANQIALTIPAQTNPAADISAAYNDLPLPAGAQLAGEFDERYLTLPTVPREYWILDIEYAVFDEYFGCCWPYLPADRRPAYETKLSLSEVAAFYLSEMSRRGWQLKEKFFQAGLPELYLFFERDGVRLPLVLETKTTGGTRISAVLPPADDLTRTLLSAWTSYTTRNSGLSGDYIREIAIDPQGKVWIGATSELSAFDGKMWTTYAAKDIGLPSGTVSDLAVDDQGRVWVGTLDGLSVFNGKVWTTYTSGNSNLPADNITAMTIDKSGRIWLGLGGPEAGRVSVFDGKTFTSFRPEDTGLSRTSYVRKIASDLQGRIWVVNNLGGVYMFKEKAWKTIRENSPYTSSVGMAIDQQGWVWLGTPDGLSVFDGEDWITYTQENSDMPFQYVEDVAIDAHDRVWIDGANGMVGVLETDGSWKDFTPVKYATKGEMTTAMAVDPQGRIWVGTDQGLNVLTPPAPAAHVDRVLPTLRSQFPTPTP